MARNEVAENAVEYRLFPRLPEHLGASEREAYLETIQDSYLAYLGSYVVDYIWQNDPFQLRIIPTSTGKCMMIIILFNTRWKWFQIHLVQFSLEPRNPRYLYCNCRLHCEQHEVE